MNRKIFNLKRTIPPVRSSISHLPSLITSLPRRPAREDFRSSFSEGGSLITIILALCCFTLSPAPSTFAVTPAPDGGYANGNTAEGTNALFSLTTGVWNTALGYQSLYHLTTGTQNTATGFQTLFSNTTGSLSTAYGSQSLYNNTTGSFNTATGFRTLYTNTTGFDNTGNGYEALAFNVTGQDNTATGFKALYNNTTASFNTAVGGAALYSNTTGFDNTANGYVALSSNTTGYQNTAEGSQALYHNTTGYQNTANGYAALYSNTTGGSNTADGYQALFSNTTGASNTATGYSALQSNTTGLSNTADGFQALFSNTTGFLNTANGFKALLNNTGGSSNTATGYSALSGNRADQNTAVGATALQNNTLGVFNIALGYRAGYNLTGNSNISIGNEGFSSDSGTIRIGQGDHTATFIAGISGVTVSGGATVYVKSDGQLGTSTSSARFKQNIEAMGKSSEVLLSLRPVTFRYKPELDPEGIPQFGLVAEEVEKVHPDLVARDADSRPYTVRYEAINAMLLNEFLKEHRTVQELKSTVARQEAVIAQQQKGMEAVIARLKEHDSKIQKVNDRLELSKAAPQMVLNNQ